MSISCELTTPRTIVHLDHQLLGRSGVQSFAIGIEATHEAWEAAVLPLNYACDGDEVSGAGPRRQEGLPDKPGSLYSEVGARAARPKAVSPSALAPKTIMH